MARLNDLANRAPLVRPVKWKVSDMVHRGCYHVVRRSSPKVHYQVYGMRRTGNHAVIEWLMQGREGRVIFCNDLQVGQHPATAPIKRMRRGEGEPAIITSYEDLDPMAVEREVRPEWFGERRQVHHVLILRDPFNLFASRYVWKRDRGLRFRTDAAHRAQLVDLWKTHARTFLEWRERTADEGSMWHVLDYNRWVTDLAYRRRMGEALGSTRPDAVIEEVGNFGGGSSFDGTAPVNGPRDRYLRRFEPLVDVPAFRALFADEELVALYKRIFAPVPGVEGLFTASDAV
ncbi:MAG: hypothetical protein RBT71_06245 [Flavobacteriales bacterium]|nr:hypothetical protein [Flavobacteriales bacterium]